MCQICGNPHGGPHQRRYCLRPACQAQLKEMRLAAARERQRKRRAESSGGWMTPRQCVHCRRPYLPAQRHQRYCARIDCQRARKRAVRAGVRARARAAGESLYDPERYQREAEYRKAKAREHYHANREAILARRAELRKWRSLK